MALTIDKLDHWIRHRFKELNTSLEEYYLGKETLIVHDDTTRPLTDSLIGEGRELIAAILANPDDIPAAYERRFHLLGNVGMYMAACRRHEVDEPLENGYSPLAEASTIASQLGSALGVAPRFMATHLQLYNRAEGGFYRTFTALDDERIFVDYNTLGLFAYAKAADALVRAMRLGVTHPIMAYLFRQAKDSLDEVLKFNQLLDNDLDVKRFFYNVRPYYKPYRVGRRDFRGANAGDFAGVNEIDLLLGLCSRDDPVYLDVIIDKKAYMPYSEQERLQDAIAQTSFLDQFLAEMEENSKLETYQENLAVFLEVCKAHGLAYAYHHDELVRKYIEDPSVHIPETQKDRLTASGPPLPVLLRALERLRDLRMGADRDDIPSRYRDLEKLRGIL